MSADLIDLDKILINFEAIFFVRAIWEAKFQFFFYFSSVLVLHPYKLLDFYSIKICTFYKFESVAYEFYLLSKKYDLIR